MSDLSPEVDVTYIEGYEALAAAQTDEDRAIRRSHGGTYAETRWVGHERCPNGDTVHVLPVTVTSSARLVSLETPGNVTASEPCPFCYPFPPGANGDTDV